MIRAVTSIQVVFLIAFGSLPAVWGAQATAFLGLDREQAFARANAEFDQAQELQTTSPDRARELFRSAAQRFESLADSGVISGKLEFNLGNAYLQAGDVGRAILHYRRAQRLIPGDPLLTDNLAAARARTLTAVAPSRRSSVMRSIFFWHYDLSTAQKARAGTVLYILIWVALVGRNFLSKRPMTVTALACGVLAVACFTSVMVTSWSDRRTPEGVVVGMDVTVHSGPGSSYQRQFVQPLQPGVEFTLLERRGSWWRLELPDGQMGWVESSTAELVVDRSG